jgi:hypothetical protein
VARRSRRWAFALAAGAGSLALALSACGGATHPTAGQEGQLSPRHPADLVGSIVVKGHTWSCRGHVDLVLVRVELDDAAKDAVRLGPGCTGTIQRLEIPGDGAALGPGGDGVKVNAGAHDLQVFGGFINCGLKAHRKHQDAIQAMGGGHIVFHHIVSHGCANSFMFINTGRGRRQVPSNVQCDACQAATHNYSVFVGSSVGSGAIGGVFTSRVPPRATSRAVSPVLAHNVWTRRSTRHLADGTG